MKIKDKMDWHKIYTAETPVPYMQFSLAKEYTTPDFSIKYFRPLLKKLYKDLQRPLNIMDLGASYGIISTLILKDISWEDLIHFYVANSHSSEEIERFYKNLVHDDKYKFYLVDASHPAMKFMNKVGACEKAFTFDLQQNNLKDELKEVIKQIDIFTIVGAINYIETSFFNKILEISCELNKMPLIAIAAYPILYEDVMSIQFEKLLEQYDYQIIKGEKSGIGRRASPKEHNIILEEGKYKQYPICQHERIGYFSASFYLAVHQSQSQDLLVWLRRLESGLNFEIKDI